MIRVLIIDDEIQIAKEIEACFLEYCNNKALPNSISIYNSFHDLQSEEYNCWDLILLDIEMPDASGIEIAKRIREKNKKIIIVFVTKYDKYIVDSYRVHAFDYISKPITSTKVKDFMDELFAYGYFKNKNYAQIEIKTTKGEIKVAINNVLYFEYIDKSKQYGSRVIKMVTKKGVYILRDKISHLYATLDINFFVIPHKSFIVNLMNIKKFNRNELTMINEDVVPLSQKKILEVRQKFNKYISNNLGG